MGGKSPAQRSFLHLSLVMYHAQRAGPTYQELGRSVARTWGFPESILVSMAPWRSPVAARPESEAEALLHVATFANHLCGIFVYAQEDQWEQGFAKLVDAFTPSLGLTQETTTAVLHVAIGKFRELAPIFGLPLRSRGYVERVGAWLVKNETPPIPPLKKAGLPSAPPPQAQKGTDAPRATHMMRDG